MAKFPELSAAQLEQVSRILGDTTTGGGIDQHFKACGIGDTSNQSTKWRRLYHTFSELQLSMGCSNQLAHFIQSLLNPAAYVQRSHDFNETVNLLNQQLSFSGFVYKDDGQFHKTSKTRSLSEAQKRASKLSNELRNRKIHSEVYKYSRAELLEDNYFHAVFEACKGLAQRIRELAEEEGDGFTLVEKVFSANSPLVAINSLSTDTERSEQKGFANLLKGCFSAIRNPLAHEPKLLWQGIDDAVDYLTLISMLHRKLDNAVKIPTVT